MTGRREGTALVIVDVQYDFMDGSLAVPDAHAVIEPIIEASKLAQYAVFTRDFHPPDHCSFSDNPEFVDKSWPSHCVQGTEGVLIHPELARMFWNAPVFSKGTDRDRETYSGFEGLTEYDGQRLSLDDYLDSKGVHTLFVVGLATDYCVRATAIDAVQYAFQTIVFADAIRGVSPVTSAVACADMADAGAAVTTIDSYKSIGV